MAIVQPLEFLAWRPASVWLAANACELFRIGVEPTDLDAIPHPLPPHRLFSIQRSSKPLYQPRPISGFTLVHNITDHELRDKLLQNITLRRVERVLHRIRQFDAHIFATMRLRIGVRDVVEEGMRDKSSSRKRIRDAAYDDNKWQATEARLKRTPAGRKELAAVMDVIFAIGLTCCKSVNNFAFHADCKSLTFVARVAAAIGSHFYMFGFHDL